MMQYIGSHDFKGPDREPSLADPDAGRKIVRLEVGNQHADQLKRERIQAGAWFCIAPWHRFIWELEVVEIVH